MGVWNRMFGGADGCRKAVRETYATHVRSAKNGHGQSRDSSHTTGLYRALGSRHRASRAKAGEDILWNELAPFLGMEEQEAVEAVAEYVVFKERPKEARITWLGDRINAALGSLTNDAYRRMAAVGMVNRVAWCALLTADTAQMLEVWVESFQQEEAAPDLLRKAV